MIEQTQAIEKYVLDELSAEERTAFESHLFDCPICADQVRQNFTVVENLKDVLREDRLTARQGASVDTPRRGGLDGILAGWREWLRPFSLVPTLAALGLAVTLGYQDLSLSSAINEAHVLPSMVVAPVARGEGPTISVNRKALLFLISFSVDSAKPDSYVCEFQTEAGQRVLSVPSEPQSAASFTMPVLLPAKLFPVGRYKMILRAASDPQRVTTYPFAVETRE